MNDTNQATKLETRIMWTGEVLVWGDSFGQGKIERVKGIGDCVYILPNGAEKWIDPYDFEDQHPEFVDFSANDFVINTFAKAFEELVP